MRDSARGPVVVFTGPTLAAADVGSLLPAETRAPAKMGDVYALVGSRVRTIVLIDGVFHREPSVWQREILAALDAGIRVVGASSMGALRAAELHELGMEGHGLVFEWFRDGVIDGDDEVALEHVWDGAASYRGLSEPLVNLRFSVANAIAAGVLGEDEATAAIAHLKGLFFPARSYAALLDAPVCRAMTPARRAALAEHLEHHRRNLKREDALGALRRVAGAPPGPAATRERSPGPPRAQTSVFGRQELAHRQIRGRRGAAWLQAIQDSPALLARLRDELVTRWFVRSWAASAGIACPAAERAEAARAWRAAHGLGDVAGWLVERGLAPAELERHLEAVALERHAIAGRGGLQPILLDWAELHGVRPAAIGRAELAAWLVRQGPAYFGHAWDAPLETLRHLQLAGELPDEVRA